MRNNYNRNRRRRSERGDWSDSETKKKKKFHWWIIPIVLVAIAIVVIVSGNLIRTADGNRIMGVSISKLPDKLVYYVGEKFSSKGLEITTTLNNGTSYTEGPETCTFSGFNSEFAEEEQQIFVSYGDRTFVYTITIKEPPRPFSPLKTISLETLPKTDYKLGDWLSVEDGVLLLTYEDGFTRRIRLEYGHIYDFSTEKPGTFTITVKLREDGYLATCTYQITVE